MTKTRQAVIRKPVSGFYLIAAAIALMIATHVSNVEAANNPDEVLRNLEQIWL